MVVEVIRTEEFMEWLAHLKDAKARFRIAARIGRMGSGNLGDCEPIGEGLSEARIHYGAGYRLYFMQRGNRFIVLLCGGDKRSQDKDIKKAKQLAKEWR